MDRRADFVAHVGQEKALRLVRRFGRLFRLPQFFSGDPPLLVRPLLRGDIADEHDEARRRILKRERLQADFPDKLLVIQVIKNVFQIFLLYP